MSSKQQQKGSNSMPNKKEEMLKVNGEEIEEAQEAGQAEVVAEAEIKE